MSQVTDGAASLHNDAIVIDGCSFFSKGWDARLEKAGVTALQMTVAWPWDDSRQAIPRYQEYYEITSNEPRLHIVETTEDIRRCNNNGHVGFILGSQNAQMLDDDPGMVEVFQRLGVRVIQLAYNVRNYLADGCLEPSNAGLSRLGKTVIKEMNRVGVQVDLSHVGERSSFEAIDVSDKPCIISHANPKARLENPRNVTDDLMKACAQAGGVVGLTPYAPINWTGGENPPSIDDFIGHVEYAAQLIGVDHISFGTDSEATPGAYPPKITKTLARDFPDASIGLRNAHPDVKKSVGFESMEALPDVTDKLLGRGWKDEDIRKFLGENLLRVYRQNWEA